MWGNFLLRHLLGPPEPRALGLWSPFRDRGGQQRGTEAVSLFSIFYNGLKFENLAALPPSLWLLCSHRTLLHFSASGHSRPLRFTRSTAEKESNLFTALVQKHCLPGTGHLHPTVHRTAQAGMLAPSTQLNLAPGVGGTDLVLGLCAGNSGASNVGVARTGGPVPVI